MAAETKPLMASGLTVSTETKIEALAPVAVERFDEYAIVGKLGVGGMAEVFLALSSGPSGFKKLLVVKRMHAHLGDDPNIVKMFLDEARLAARLSHAHVVQTYKVGTVAGRPFLAMEYLDGQAANRLLKRCVDRGRNLPPALAARVIADVLDGLDYAHTVSDYDGTPLDIVHRDISPHNVFVGYDGTVKVLDFGIAKAATHESNTRTGTIKGKFAYIAPEQARGEVIDGRADVWSAGVSMWELLTGKRLFRRATDVAVLQATLSDPIPMASTTEPSVPLELAKICDRALQRDVELRWPSARAMRDAIEEWLGTRGREGSRGALAELMKDLFTEDLAEQRAQIKACVERVEAGTGNFATLSQVMALPGGDEADVSTRVAKRGSVPRPLPTLGSQSQSGVSSIPQPEGAAPRRRAWLLVGLAGLFFAVMIGVAVWPRTLATPTPIPPPTSVVAPPPSSVVELAPPTSVIVDVPPTTVAEAPPTSVAAPPEHEHTHHARPAAPPPVTHTETAVAPPVAPPPPTAEATGHLVLDATPYAIVSLEGRRLGITPIDVDLPAGAHVLTLRNPEQGLETTYRVTIHAGETLRRTVALE